MNKKHVIFLYKNQRLNKEYRAKKNNNIMTMMIKTENRFERHKQKKKKKRYNIGTYRK